MMRVDVLFVLLFLEFTAFCIVLSLFLFCRNRKHKQLYRKTLSEVLALKSSSTAPASRKPGGQVGGAEGAAVEKTVSNSKYEEALKERDLLAAKAAELEKRLETDNKRLDALQKKYATLEQEYSVLYGKHFEGKTKNNPA